MLEFLIIPSQVRGSVYPIVDDYLEPRPSIWRINTTGYHLFFESEQMQRTTTTTTNDMPIQLGQEDVLSYNVTIMVQMSVQAGDVLGFLVPGRGVGGRIEHLPLLYKPGPTPGSFTPIIIPNFTPTSGPPPSESSVEPSPSGPFDGELGGTVNRMCLWKVNVCVLPFCRSVCRLVI